MKRKVIIIGVFLLVLGLVQIANAFVVNEIQKEPVTLTKANLEGESRELAKTEVNSLIAESPDAREKYYVNGQQPAESKIEIKERKGTHTVIATIHYLNGETASYVTTKDKINYKTSETK